MAPNINDIGIDKWACAHHPAELALSFSLRYLKPVGVFGVRFK
jgi:hypothetical protein